MPLEAAAAIAALEAGLACNGGRPSRDARRRATIIRAAIRKPMLKSL
jgi:hypothetical protein